MIRYKLVLLPIFAGMILAGCAAPGSSSEAPTWTPLPNLPPTVIGPLPPRLVTPTPFPASGTPEPRSIEVTPPGLGLTGKLVYSKGPLGVSRLDFATNTGAAIYQPPQNGVVNAAAVSPEGSLIAIAYGPPPAPGKPQLYNTGIYVVPADGSAPPEAVIPVNNTQDFYFTPTWSPDGRYLYYLHFASPTTANKGDSGFVIERMDYPGGGSQMVLQNGIITRLTPDGSKLVYVSLDEQTYLNNLRVANPDGTDAHDLLPAGNTWIIDALGVSPDSQTIIFSMGSVATPQASGWLDRFMALGAGVAQAHSLPSDLWTIPITGGKPKRLTNLNVTGLAASYSPDGRYIAFLCVNGIFVMNADGSNIKQLVDGPQAGTLQWIP